MTSTEEDGWGYMNKEGKIVIPQVFYNANEFSEGLAIIKTDNLHPSPKVTKVKTSPNGVQYSTADMSEFTQLGSMLIIQNTTMYVFEIKGSSVQNESALAAKCVLAGGISGDYKFNYKNGNNCETIKNTFRQGFSIYCKGTISTGN